jgi:octanoyl-[GcvH]:protein N-octanoyltransferase
MTKPVLRLVTDSFPDDPALDTAVSRALLERVAAGELPETLRLAQPGPMVPFAKQDAIAAGYAAAVAAAREHGFEAVLRMAGGRAAVFHEGTLELAHAIPDPDPRPGIHGRFRETAELLAHALGPDARIGELPGEYCPGGYSINLGGRVKVAGIGQRLIRGAAHVGAVVVATGASRIAEVLVPVYAALRLEFDPTTAGEAGVPLPGLISAVRAQYAERYELVPVSLDTATLELARTLRPEHLSPAQGTGRPSQPS